MTAPINVLLIVIGGARADRLSCYGYGRQTTPALDAIAREGVRFSQMITTAPRSLAAHASLFTGVFPSTHGATEESRHLGTRHVTASELFAAAGYRTAAFFPNATLGTTSGLNRGFQRFDNQVPLHVVRARLYARRTTDRLLRRTDAGARRTNRAVMRWLATCRDPFFAFVHYDEAAAPFSPPPPFDERFLPRGVIRARARAVFRDTDAALAGRAALTREGAAIQSGLYDGALAYVDSRIRELSEYLRTTGRWNRTLVVITADHGTDLGTDGGTGHGDVLRDSMLRVPLLIRCPGAVPEGYVVDHTAQSIDVAPTIAHLTGVDARMQSQGRPLIAERRPTPGPPYAFAEAFRPDLRSLVARFPEVDTTHLEVRMKAVRGPREKYIWRSDEENALYDLEADPAERHNLVAERSEQADALRRVLFDWLAGLDRSGVEEWEGAAVESDGDSPPALAAAE